jgi:hypothetical protein
MSPPRLFSRGRFSARFGPVCVEILVDQASTNRPGFTPLKMADNDTSSKWPNLTVGFTFLSAVVFLASLLFVSGLSLGLNHNLLGLCDLSDYLRVAPSWAIPMLLGVVIGMLFRLGIERPPSVLATDVEGRKRLRESIISLPRWLANLNKPLFYAALGIVFVVIQAFPKDILLTLFAWWYCPTVVLLVCLSLMPGWVHLFRLPPRFSSFIPITIWILAFPFWTGLYFLTIAGPILSFRTIMMKDHSQFEGRVVLELNRYVVVQNSDKKLIALQSSEIQVMNLLDHPPQGSAVSAVTGSATASPSTP